MAHIALEIPLIVVGIVSVFIVLDAALRTFVLLRLRTGAVHEPHLSRIRRSCCVRFPSRSFENRDRVMACTHRSLRCLRSRPSIVVVFASHASSRRRSRTAGTTRPHERLVLVHARLRWNGRHGVDIPGACRGRDRACTACRAHRASADDLLGVPRREVMVTQLSVRVGTPIVAKRRAAHRAGILNDLDPVWNEWMQWFSELGNAHVARRGLLPTADPERSGSPRPGTLLDAGCARPAVLNIPFTPAPGLCIRSTSALRRSSGTTTASEHDLILARRPDQRRAKSSWRSRAVGGCKFAGEGGSRTRRRRRLASELRPRRFAFNLFVMAPNSPGHADRRAAARRQRWGPEPAPRRTREPCLKARLVRSSNRDVSWCAGRPPLMNHSRPNARGTLHRAVVGRRSRPGSGCAKPHRRALRGRPTR